MSSRAIIHISAHSKVSTRINYSRRVYAIVRRYTPEAVEGEKNECFAELTGLRTFFKMTYQEIADKILADIYAEIGVQFKVRVVSASLFDSVKNKNKKQSTVSTYKEINKLFVGKSFVDASKRISPRLIKRVRLTVPFLGKVR